MSKGALALRIIAAVAVVLLVMLAFRGLEERARVNLPSFKGYPHWIFAERYTDPAKCEARASPVGFACHYAPRWQIWLWRAQQEYYRVTGTKSPPISQ
jgi:hypothetical protein